jgi:hypothetical protein
MTMTIELPDTLIEQLRARALPEQEINNVVVKMLESWVAQPQADNGAQPAESAAAFARRFIAQNRALFEALARR